MKMAINNKDMNKLAQAYLRDQGFYQGDIDGMWGRLSDKAFRRYSNHLRSRGLDIGGSAVFIEDAISQTVSGVVVLDPGHGGVVATGGSSPNNATSASGVLEKTMTLDMARRIRRHLNRMIASRPGSDVKVYLTRSGDTNMGLSERAEIAGSKGSDVFLSIHFNSFNGSARGTETLILSAANGNVNEAEDRELAQQVQNAVYNAIRQFDAGARDRGVKDNQRLGVLNDISLGNIREDASTRACLLEIEFIDNPMVDKLLNTGHDANAVNEAIASAIASALLDNLRTSG
jgi:N-acetylmuramoyl-L-alanine amidase